MPVCLSCIRCCSKFTCACLVSRAQRLQPVTSNGFLGDVSMTLESNASMDLLSVSQVEEKKLHMAAVSNLARHHRALV